MVLNFKRIILARFISMKLDHLIFTCSGSVVRPIISPSRGEDSGSNPGRSIKTFFYINLIINPNFKLIKI